MRCPTCGGTGSFILRRQVGPERLHDCRFSLCTGCGGRGTVTGLAGTVDDDGELPIGWSPPSEPLYPLWDRSRLRHLGRERGI